METYNYAIVQQIKTEIQKSNRGGVDLLSDLQKTLDLSESEIKEYEPIIEEFTAENEKQKTIAECKAALIKRAKGYDYEETQKMGRRDKNGEAVLYVKTITKHVPPSEQAIKMLLDMLEK